MEGDAKRFRRLLEIIDTLHAAIPQNSRQLARRFRVSRRTIFRDLNTLQDLGIGVVFDEVTKTYGVLGRSAIPAADVSFEEALALLVVCESLGDTQTGLPFHGGARSAASKIISVLPDGVRSRVSRLANAFAVRLEPGTVSLDYKPAFDKCVEAYSLKRPLRVEYMSLTEEAQIKTELSPYKLLYTRHAWYCIGRSSLHDEVRMFHLGRMSRIEIMERGSYRIPLTFSIDGFFGSAWHLIRGESRVYEVAVRFSAKVAQNVSEVRWHKTQEIKSLPDGRILLTVKVSGLSEIFWWVLGYGAHAEVLRPASLRKRVAEQAMQMVEMYATPNSKGEAAATASDSPTVPTAKTPRRKK